MTIGRTQAAAQLDARGLAPRRSLGQNFVVDANTVRRIARLADIGPGHHVVEVGAGLGSLTRALAETGATVIAVEIDDHLIPILRENTEGLDNVRVIHADAKLQSVFGKDQAGMFEIAGIVGKHLKPLA